MANLVKSDVKAVLRGMKIVSEIAVSHQKKSLNTAWRNSSLRPAFDKIRANTNSVDRSKNVSDLLHNSSASLQEMTERVTSVVEGIRQYTNLRQHQQTFENSDDEFEIDDAILETAAENILESQIKIEPKERTTVEPVENPDEAPPIVKVKVQDKTNKPKFENVNFEDVVVKEKLKKFEKHRPTLSASAKETRVPSSRIGRLASYGSLAAGLGMGALAEVTRRVVGKSESTDKLDLTSSAFLTEANVERIVRTLCRVRGAALKLGQMASMDSTFFSPQVQQLFERVRQSADFMPSWQMEKVMREELGSEWRSKLQSFEEKPFAAASIGEVHLGVLHDGREVAIKIQYPGVAKGISSDISNLMSVMKMWNFLPDGLYMENIAAVAKWELAREVDYSLEAENGRRFREIMSSYPEFYVPKVIDELSTSQVLTTELVDGIALDKIVDAPQHIRDKVCKQILRLCLKEVFIFQFMQTDPNWSNFFYNQEDDKIMLLDFGACREFDKAFVDDYMRLIQAAAQEDKEKIMEFSVKLGFLTGYEAQVMKKAHTDATLVLGSAFRYDGLYDFGQQKITDSILSIVPTMLKHRLTPPPEETYSLHRKMAGLFLLCAKLRGNVNCYELFEEILNEFKFAPESS